MRVLLPLLPLSLLPGSLACQGGRAEPHLRFRESAQHQAESIFDLYFTSADQEAAKGKLVATQESTASDLFMGNNAGRDIVVVYEPVIDGGVVKYVLGIGMDPDRLSRLLAVQPLPTGWYSILFDGADRVIARSVAGDQYVGVAAPDWFKQRNARRGILHGIARSGSAVLLGYQGLRDAPWTISVAVPTALV